MEIIATALIIIDRAILNLIVNNVEFDNLFKYGIFSISSPKSAISAASIAISLPIDPIATLTSDVLSVGASLTPFPIIQTLLPDFLNFSIHWSFSFGSKFPWTSEIPTCLAN